MPSDSYSFLDVAVLDEVRERFAAGDALLILSADLEEVIWANGPGAALLGYPNIEAILGSPAGLGAGARRQIAATRGFPEIGRDRPVMVRLTSGVSSHALALSASAISLPDGERAILLASPAPAGEGQIAGRAIGGFSEAGHFVALLDERGKTAAASPGFEALGIAAQSLAGLAARTGGARVAKQMLRCAAGQLPAGLARLTDDPAMYLLVAVDERSAAERAALQEQQEPAADGPSEALPGAEGDERPADAKTPPADAGPRQPEAEADQAGHDTWYFSSDDLGRREPVKTPAREAAESPLPAAAREAAPQIQQAGAEAEPSGGDIAADAEAPAVSTAEAEAGIEPPTGPEKTGTQPEGSLPASAIDRDSPPVRFVWRTDAQGRFSQISPEFAKAVAVDASEIVGQRFQDVAASLGFDAAGEIAGLLERRDTWSGRSVLWPVAGTRLSIPVDLAALPVYGRDRNFEGFRGFGVARLGDAVAEPEAPQPAMPEAPAETSEPPPDPAPPAEEEAPSDDPFRGETPALNIVQMPARRSTDKIIRLAEHRPPATDRGSLSTGERIAFQQIAERLKRDSAASKAATGAEEKSEPAGEAEAARPQQPVQASDPQATATGPETSAKGTDREPPEAADDLDDLRAMDGQQAQEPAASGAEQGRHSDGLQAGADETAPLEQGPESDGATVRKQPSAGAPTRRPRKQPRPGMSLLDFAQWDQAAEAGAAGTSTDTAAGPAGEGAAGAGEGAAEVAPPAAEPSAGTPETAENGIGQGSEAAPTPGPDAAPAEQEAATPQADAPAFEQGAAPESELPAGERAGIAILEKLPVPVLVHSGDTLHYANPEFLELTGYGSLEQLAVAGGIGALFVETYEDDDDAPDRRDRQLRLTTARNEEFPVEAFLQSAPWNGGKALLLVLRRVADAGFGAAPSPIVAELEARVAEMRTIIDTATDGVVLIAGDGTIRSISRPAEALFSFDSDEVAGKPFESLFAIESQRSVRDYLNGLSDNGVASVLNDGREVIGREAQGRFIPLFMTIGKLPNDSGYCAVMRDITQWKRAEEDLTQARALAERASSQKTDFLARVSHEIRTPLNAIIGFSELMIDEKFGPVANDRYRDYLRDINRSGNHVLDLVNDLLDISKIEAGQQDMDFEAVSLNDTLAETVAMMQPQANRERVIIRSSFASGLPDVVADLRSVRQIALNILSNAVRYTQAGGQVIISTAYEPAGDVAIRVRDTGIGMTHAEIEQALKPFKQINSLKRGRGDGTGLGLPLTKAMVEANRARFTINSTPGEGTLVEITFPSTRVLAD